MTKTYERGRGSTILLMQLVWAGTYGALLHALGTPTGSDMLDGALGVMLGLYISSHPAANAIDVLFADRFALRRITSTRFGVYWLLLNMLVLMTGWLVIFVGTTRFVRDLR